MRIVQLLIGGEVRTAQELAELLHNIPQSTLYRHVNTLSKAGILKIVEERRHRGMVERVYSLAMDDNELFSEGCRMLRRRNDER